ncbi:hypothetical protein [Chengkuizengella marina]|uniref:hypothetical protein n=1 Tax=Chengkuizengella marina TaxID=2507566 RepID=UPI00136829CC|nr:hypothetical protein [Chengkuizengella marina]
MLYKVLVNNNGQIIEKFVSAEEKIEIDKNKKRLRIEKNIVENIIREDEGTE